MLTPQINWIIVKQSSTTNSFNGRCNLCIDEKISIINFNDRRQLLNERNELRFKCIHKSKSKLSWLGATEATTLDNSGDIDAGWFLFETFYFSKSKISWPAATEATTLDNSGDIDAGWFLFETFYFSKSKLSWLGATEATTLDNSGDIDAGWFLFERFYFSSY